MELHARKGHTKREDEFGRSSVVEMETGKTGHVKPYTLDANVEWFLEAKISITFWANNAQYGHARQIAERALKARLYEGILMEIHNARLAVSNGDKREAFDALERMQKIVDG